MHSISRLGAAAAAVLMMAGCAHRVAQAPAPMPAPQYGGSGGGYNQGYNGGYQQGYNGGYDGRYDNRGARQQMQAGYVQSIEPLRAENRTSGAGGVIGGAVGGLVGHNIDHGDRKAAATLIGVVAGAIIGNQIEKNNSGARDGYRVSIRLDSGEQRSYDYAQLNEIRVGDRVRVDASNQVYRY